MSKREPGLPMELILTGWAIPWKRWKPEIASHSAMIDWLSQPETAGMSLSIIPSNTRCSRGAATFAEVAQVGC